MPSDTPGDVNSLPSPQPSNRGGSSKTSRKSSPAVEESKRRRSNRVAELENDRRSQDVQRLEEEQVIDVADDNDDNDIGDLVIKRRKKDGNTPSSRPRSKTPQTPQKKVITVQNGKLVFNEPPTDEPIMAVTGLPLDAPPSSKIKKEALWPTKRGRGGRPSKAKREEEEGSSEAEQISKDLFDGKYKSGLKTTINEKLEMPSSLRASQRSKPVAKKGAPSTIKESKSTKLTALKTPRKNGKGREESKRKIKNASPKKARANPFGFDDPLQLAGAKRENAFDFNDITKDNEDFCSSCGEPGIFLCCESCPKSFHFACCDPPYDEDHLPEDEWYCNECSAKRNPPLKNNTGLFGKLLNAIPYRNPIQFKLPKKIRDRFEGVVTGEYGEYEHTGYKPFKPTVIGAFEQTDPELHYDKDGKPIICQRCGFSGISPNKLNGEADKLIIQCEYCPSAWHLDCLDPPLSTVKQLGRKWKCPNHADHLMRNKQRRLKNPKVIDVDQIAGFKNNGDIEVLLDDDENGNESDRDNNSENEIVDIPTPAYLNNRDKAHGIAAEIPKSTWKLWNDQFVIHRLPEKGILIDFIGKIADERDQQRAKVEEILKLQRENKEILSHLDENYTADEQKTIKSLLEFKDKEFEDLLSVASKELKESEEVSKDEINELLQIKKLIALKGKDELLSFLNS